MVSALEGRHTAKGLLGYPTGYHRSSQIPALAPTLGPVQPQGHSNGEGARAARGNTLLTLLTVVSRDAPIFRIRAGL